MCDSCHEAEIASQNVRREITMTNSLSIAGGFTATLACEHAIRGLWYHATGEAFPHENFRPFHKPEVHLNNMGILVNYSNSTKSFLSKMTGYAFDDARFANTQAYKDHTKPVAAGRAKEIVEGIEIFIQETRSLIGNQNVTNKIIEHKNKI